MQTPATRLTDLVRALALAPHPEGGFFREVHRAAATVETPGGRRSACTAILFLVGPDQVSRFHRLASEELWLHVGGAPLELVMLAPGSAAAGRVVIGGRGGDARRQARVPALTWQAARPAAPPAPADRDWCLVSCVVTPGFDYRDFEMASREALLAEFPAEAGLIGLLT